MQKSGSGKCAATATAKLEIWLARNFCRFGVSPLVINGSNAEL